MSHGKYTSKLGRKLVAIIKERDTGLKVYYDHGDYSDPNYSTLVCEPGLFLNDSRLAIADIILVEEATGKVKVVCQVEEGKKHATKISGHMITFLISERIHTIHGDYDLTEDTILLIALSSIKQAELVKERVKNLLKPEFRSRIEKIQILGNNEIKNLIDDLEKEFLKYID